MQSCAARSTGKKLAPACLLKACLRRSWVAKLGRAVAEALHLLTCRLCVAACAIQTVNT